MAKQIGQRSGVPKPPPKRRREFLQEARAAAEATGEILTERFGQQEWIEQVVFAVLNAVQNGIENLSGTSISSNAHPEDGYKFGARTAEELKQSQQLVAPAGGALMPKPPVEANNGEWVPPPEDIEAAAGSRIIIPGQPTPPPKAKGWLL